VQLFEFAIRASLRAHDLDTVEGRLAALDAAAPIVRRIKDWGLRRRYALSLDRWTGMMDEEFVVRRVLAEASQAGRAARGREATGRAAGPGAAEARNGSTGGPAGASGPVPLQSGTGDGYDWHDPVVNVERQALKLAVQRPALCGPAFDALAAGVFTVPTHAAVFQLIAARGGVTSARSAREWSDQLRAAAPDDGVRSFVTRLAVEPLEVPGPAGEPDEKFAESVLARIEELAVSRDIATVKSRLQRLSPVAAQGDYNRMFGDLVALEQRRKVLSERASGAL
jgi:DNA primase